MVLDFLPKFVVCPLLELLMLLVGRAEAAVNET